jgi:hypothetical protein
MSIRLRVACWLFYFVSLSFVSVGLLYAFSPTIMPYHERFLGTSHSQLDPRVAALLLATMRGAAAFFISFGIGLALMAKNLLSQGNRWVWWIIGIMSLTVLVPLLVITLGIGLYTPWWGVALMIVLVTAALVLSREAAMRNPRAD